MRVLHVVSNLDPLAGGVVTATLGLLTAQKRVGLEPQLVMTYPSGRSADAAKSLEDAGIPTTVIGPCDGRLNRHKDIRPTMARLLPSFDLVHTHGVWEEIQHVACRQARSHAKPYICSAHGMLDSWSLARGKWKKRLLLAWRVRDDLNHASSLHFTASRERDGARSLRLRSPTIVLPLGLDVDTFSEIPPLGRFRERYGIRDRRLIVFMGRLHAGKGMEYLIPAMALLPDDVICAAVGPDSAGFREQLETRASTLGVGDRVMFTGPLHGQEKVSALVDADLFCLPSDHENFGMVIVEALAAGTPAIISDQVKICDELREAGVAGVTSRRPEELAHELQRWLDDAELRLCAKRKSREFVLSKFNWDKIAAQWQRHYSRICSERSEN